MELNDFQTHIAEKLSVIELRFHELLSKHTSFKIGGPAEVMAFPKNEKELLDILVVSKEMDIKPAILGAGTNILAPDKGMTGLVLCLKDCLSGMEIVDTVCLRIMAGVTMSRAAVFAANHGLTGLEFAHGIPGTIGGGIFMNAGAYGSDISHICKKVRAVDMDGNIHEYENGELEFRYRHSILEDSGEIVVSADFELSIDSVENIKARMKELQNKRSASQPLDLPSAGSAFKRPAGGYAAALIDQAGLKGFQLGQAAISSKHAGFAVNLGGATAAEVQSLLQHVSDRVYCSSGIRLEPEIKIW